MVEVVQTAGAELIELYKSFLGIFPPSVGTFLNFLILVVLVVVYAIIVWNGYRFIARKDPLGLNLSRYNKATNPFSEKLVAGILYLIEYILIIPFVIFLVLGIFTLLIIILSPNENTAQILIISSIIIAAIRMTSYYKEGLSQEIAKLLPLVLLATFVIDPAFFSQAAYFEKVITQITQIPELISSFGIYMFFIIILEAMLRFLDFIFLLLGISNPEEVEEDLGKKN